jgi:hypothetical protein
MARRDESHSHGPTLTFRHLRRLDSSMNCFKSLSYFAGRVHPRREQPLTYR